MSGSTDELLGNKDKTQITNPKTGDKILYAIGGFLISIICLCATYYIAKTNKK